MQQSQNTCFFSRLVGSCSRLQISTLIGSENVNLKIFGFSLIFGFSITGGTIPTGNGVLVEVSFIDYFHEICIENVILADSQGTSLDVTLGDCY